MAMLTRADPTRTIIPLTVADIPRLRLDWRSRLSEREVRRILENAPGLSLWNPETLEYAIAAPWRNRDEIVQIADLSAVRQPEEMVRNVAAAAREWGALLTVIVEIDEKRPASFYERVGFEHLEQVVTFRLDRRRAPRIQRPESLRFLPANPFDEAMLPTLLEVDHRAFPWIWWNSEREFVSYGMTPGVALFIGYQNKKPVSYIGFTVVDDWGHIDRIAVDPDRQGSGLGLQTLAFAIETMGQQGVRRIGLSTQSDNERSQRLYRRFGFERTRDTDYDLWGDTVHRAPGLAIAPTGTREP